MPTDCDVDYYLDVCEEYPPTIIVPVYCEAVHTALATTDDFEPLAERANK